MYLTTLTKISKIGEISYIDPLRFWPPKKEDDPVLV